jgi:hypothetical protein
MFINNNDEAIINIIMGWKKENNKLQSKNIFDVGMPEIDFSLDEFFSELKGELKESDAKVSKKEGKKSPSKSIPKPKPKKIAEEKQTLSTVEDIASKLDRLEKTHPVLTEKTNDPLALVNTPKYMTQREFQNHYKLLLDRLQIQLGSLGGGGEVNLLRLDDVEGDNFNKEQDGQLILWSEPDQKFVSSSERGVDDFFSEGIGGYEFTGGFSDRESGQTGSSDFGTFVPYTQPMADAGQWRRFGFSELAQQTNDVAYFPTNARPNRVFDQTKGLFGGMFMPSGVTELIDYGFTSPNYNSEVNSGISSDLNYTAADGSFDFRECEAGDLLQLRFDFNIRVQVANTTLEIALIWQTRDENDNPTFTFALTGQPIFYGTGTVGRTFLNRPFLSAYFASAEDTNARALLAIRADNPIQIAPLSTLVTIQR